MQVFQFMEFQGFPTWNIKTNFYNTHTHIFRHNIIYLWLTNVWLVCLVCCLGGIQLVTTDFSVEKESTFFFHMFPTFFDIDLFFHMFPTFVRHFPTHFQTLPTFVAIFFTVRGDFGPLSRRIRLRPSMPQKGSSRSSMASAVSSMTLYSRRATEFSSSERSWGTQKWMVNLVEN